MYLERSDDIDKEIFNFSAVHGKGGCGYLSSIGFNYVPTISNDIKVVMITNFPHQHYLNKLYIDSGKMDIEYIILNKPVFRCGIDLIEPLYDYIKTINNKYVLYLDASDTAVMKDLHNPKEILDFYKCKILFNAEDGYSFPDHGCVDKSYLSEFSKITGKLEYQYYGEVKEKTNRKNIETLSKKLNGITPYTKSLNAGLFLGEREYMVNILSEMIEWMYKDPSKGYPYGEIENQKMWQYLQSECKNGEIEIDYLNHYFLWAHDRKLGFPVDSWEHFNYFNKLIKP